MDRIRTLEVHWFEIPALNINRAIAFYESVFNIKLLKQTYGSIEMAWFTSDNDANNVSGLLIKNEAHYKPSPQGTLIYFSSPDIAEELKHVETAGGKILLQKTQITTQFGFMGLFQDSEGNRIGLHSET